MSRRRPPRALAGDREGGRRGSDSYALGGDHVEGRRAVRELLVAGRRSVLELLVAEGQDSSPLLDEIETLARARDVVMRVVPHDVLRSRAATASPQGVVAFATPIEAVDLDDLVIGGNDRRAATTPEGAVPFLFVLSEVTDPHNLGAILRSALGAGATGIVLGKHRAAHLSPAAVKAAAGAVEHLSFAAVAGVAQLLAELGRRGVWSVGLDPQGEESIATLRVATEPLALVVGAEGQGLSRLVKDRCDVLCRIPLYGAVESLNVSVAAALAGFAVATRRSTNESKEGAAT